MGGAYLSRPVKQKTSETGNNVHVSYGVSSMQGWRLKQEDAHTCIVDFDENMSLFGVYDGHGGFEVARYTSEKFPNFLRNSEKYKEQNYREALIQAFLGFDDTIPTPEVQAVLREMVKADNEEESECEGSSELVVVGGSSNAGCSSNSDEYDDDLDTPESLRADANKPLEEVMASYRVPNLNINKLKSETSKPASPYLRGRRSLNNGLSDGAASASSAGCSSSSTNSNSEAVTESKPASNDATPGGSNSRIIPIEVSSEETTSGCGSEAEKSNSAGLANGAVNGSVSEEVETCGKRSKRISAGSSSSENTTPSGTPGTSPKKTKKLALDDLDDSTVIKNFITNDEIAEDDEDDSEDETFQPTDDTLESDDDGEDDQFRVKQTLAKQFLKCLASRTGGNYNFDRLDDETDEETTDEEESSPQSEAEAVNEEEESGGEEQGEESSEEESAGDSEEDEDEMACEMLSGMGREKPGIDSGCTAVVALLKGRDLYVANAGDSRCIVCKNGQAVDMSEDHKPEDEAERARILKAGGTVTLDGRVNGGLNLSRAIGDHCYKKKEELPNTEQMITALPDVRTMKLEPDVEFLVLACDGIWNSMTSQEVVDFVRPKILENENLSEICEELFDKCLAPDTWGDGTGCDNMTCIIVKPAYGDDETSPVESNTTKKTDLETNEIGAAGDATTCAVNNPEKSVSEASTENGVTAADDTKNGETVAAGEDEQPSNVGDSTTATVKAQKRCADEVVADDDHNKRQKTDDAKVELSS